jgi:rhodanese-related sulfurtransferase
MAEHDRFEKLVTDAKKNITEIRPTDAAEKLKGSGAVVVDVREQDEWDEEHIPDAIHLSRGTIELDIEEKVPDLNTTVIVHCGGGGRSALAAEACKRWATKMSAQWLAALKPGKPLV